MHPSILTNRSERCHGLRLGLILTACAVVFGACDSEEAGVGADKLLSLRVGGVQRILTLHIPPNHRPDKPAPLVIAFHGTPGNGPGMQITTGLDEISDANGWLIAYPNGIDGSWAAGCECSDLDLTDVDDIEFVRELIDRVGREANVASESIYVVGFSMGGIFSYRVACDLSSTIDRVVAVGSSMTWAQRETCKVDAPVPILTIVGTNDPAFPWSGSGLGPGHAMPIDTTQVTWAALNQCGLEPSIDHTLPPAGSFRVRRELYSQCVPGGTVELHAIEGAGHIWPETANATIAAFFKR